MSNRCPHQGGPLGEGSIETGMLRCPWHGHDYCPLESVTCSGWRSFQPRARRRATPAGAGGVG
ncbi:MAG: Rieske (2Fe-2S) protein [Solirubrobacteraceae bacterium]